MPLLDGILGRYDGLPDAQVPPPPEWLAIFLHGLFVRRLESFLESYGVSDYIFTSGFRDVSKNESVGGVKNSAHIHGLGADLKLAGIVPADLAQAWKSDTGGYALDEGSHFHFNLPRAWGWKVIRWLAVAVLLAAVALIFFLIESRRNG